MSQNKTLSVKTPMEQLFDLLSVKGILIDWETKAEFFQLEKEHMCAMWDEGNKQGWAMETDDPEAGEDYFNTKYHP